MSSNIFNDINNVQRKDKVLAITIILFTLIVLCLSTNEYKTNIENQYDYMDASLAQYIEDAEVSIDEYLDNNFTILEYIASLPDIYGMDWEKQYNFLHDSEENLNFEHFFIVDTSGKGYYANTGEIKDHSNEVFFTNVLNNSRYITEPYTDIENVRSITTLSVSIYNGGKKVGALCGVINLQNIYNRIEKLKFANYDFAAIINRNGEYIVHKNMNFVHNKEVIFRHLKSPEEGKLKEILLSSRSSNGKLKINNKDYFIYSVPLKCTEWNLVILADISSLVKEEHLFYAYNIITVIGFVLAVFIGLNLINKSIRNARLAYTDTLTKINNRQVFDNTINKLENKYKISTAIIYFDLNNFKELNDTFGHKAGDEVLIEFASILKRTFSKNAMVSRTGGDEFIVILVDRTIFEIEKYIDEIEELIELYNRRSIYAFSMSYGYALRGRGETINLKEICEEADENMYKYKKQFK